MARLRWTGLTAKEVEIWGSAVAITVPSRFSMKSAQATVSAMIADRSSLRIPILYCLEARFVILLCEQPWMSANQSQPLARTAGEGLVLMCFRESRPARHG